MTDELRQSAEALARLEPATADRHGVTIAPVALLDGAIAVARAFLGLRAAASAVVDAQREMADAEDVDDSDRNIGPYRLRLAQAIFDLRDALAPDADGREKA